MLVQLDGFVQSENTHITIRLKTQNTPEPRASLMLLLSHYSPKVTTVLTSTAVINWFYIFFVFELAYFTHTTFARFIHVVCSGVSFSLVYYVNNTQFIHFTVNECLGYFQFQVILNFWNSVIMNILDMLIVLVLTHFC